jgi:hypothetical protein
MEGLEQRLHSPTPREVALELNRPWEGTISYDQVVIRDGDRYRMWYRGARDTKTGTWHTCYAESRDGVEWERVTVGEVGFEGSTDNNIVIDGAIANANAVCVFKDENPNTPDDERYKATGIGKQVEGRDAIVALVSPDGLHWRPMQQTPIVVAPAGPDYAFDSHNIFFWDNERGRYAGYLRGWIKPGIRAIRWGTSPDFRTWSELAYIDLGNSPPEHLYKNACQTYFRAPHLYLMFPKRFLEDRKAVQEHTHGGISDAVFMTSRDGHHWDRRFMDGFLRPGLDPDNWTERNMYIGPNVVPTGPGEMSLYFIEHYRHPTCRIRRGTLRTDGFVSIHGDYAGGELVTKPLTFQGKELVINYATSAAGSVRVEIQDAKGRAIRGYGLGQSPETYGDDIEHVVRWKKGSDLSALAGRPIRLRFVLKDADLYSIRFRP